MNYNHIFFISPPFYSHFNPLITLAKSFKRQGARVTFGCSLEFKSQIQEQDLEFYEIDISENKNVGVAEGTEQPESERSRLDEFFAATRQGAVETLIAQSKHRGADMLYNPERLLAKIGNIDKSMDIDLYIVDVLSYSVTLSLYCLGLPFITFCPPHPNTIPEDGIQYGVPPKWPSEIKVSQQDLDRLMKVAINTEKEFTQVFNSTIEKWDSVEKVENAFSLVSEKAIIYNYFDFNNRENKFKEIRKIFLGNCFESEELSGDWLERIEFEEKKILISLGTFLSNREDVLEKLIIYTKKIYPEAILVVSAGENREKLIKYSDERTIIESFVPQKALMPYMDMVIFHGGCNTLTEAMYYGKKMIILPFSSDQFNIAYDMEKNVLAEILDPNGFTKMDLERSFIQLENQSSSKLEHWKKVSQSRGSDYGAEKILNG